MESPDGTKVISTSARTIPCRAATSASPSSSACSPDGATCTAAADAADLDATASEATPVGWTLLELPAVDERCSVVARARAEPDRVKLGNMDTSPSE